MKAFALFAQLADSIVFWGFTLTSIYYLWNGQPFEASALLCAAVVWQRFENLEMIKAANEIKDILNNKKV